MADEWNKVDGVVLMPYQTEHLLTIAAELVAREKLVAQVAGDVERFPGVVGDPWHAAELRRIAHELLIIERVLRHIGHLLALRAWEPEDGVDGSDSPAVIAVERITEAQKPHNSRRKAATR